jgi:hypothetical protein
LPWRYALTICAAALGLGIAGYAATSSAGSMAATAGFSVGLFAALSGGLRASLIAGLGFTCAAGLVLSVPVLPVVLALCIALSLIAAVEVARVGTRISVMVLLGVVLFAIATERRSDVRTLAPAAVGLGGGYLVTAHLRMSSILRPLRGQPGRGGPAGNLPFRWHCVVHRSGDVDQPASCLLDRDPVRLALPDANAGQS